MNLVKSKWLKNDIEEFLLYINSLENKDKVEWTKNIYNTSVKCLAIKVPTLRKIANEISKGDYLSFVDYFLDETYENVAINGLLIQKIKDFDIFKKYLLRYIDFVDCWASCDLLIFKNLKFTNNQLLELSKELIKDSRLFARRIGVLICFAFIEDRIDNAFKVISQLKDEKEYYVNMCVSWLMCECFIKQKEKTMNYLLKNSDRINDFTINKFVSKCRDSYRVSKEDKDMLLNFKR